MYASMVSPERTQIPDVQWQLRQLSLAGFEAGDAARHCVTTACREPPSAVQSIVGRLHELTGSTEIFNRGSSKLCQPAIAIDTGRGTASRELEASRIVSRTAGER